MKEEPFIALDCDQVVADTNINVFKLAKKHFGKSINYPDVKYWNCLDDVIGRDAALKLFVEAWSNWKTVPEMEPNAVKYANQLNGFGHLFLVTRRQGLGDTANVLKWGAWKGLKVKGVLAIDLNAPISKLDFSPPFSVIIDDSPTTAIEAIKDGTRVYLRNQPWNQKLPPRAEKGVIRVDSLAQVVADLKAYTKKRFK